MTKILISPGLDAMIRNNGSGSAKIKPARGAAGPERFDEPDDPGPTPSTGEKEDKTKAQPPAWRDHAISAPALCDKRFPLVQFLIPGLIPEGLTLLVSRPKLGKSWLLLQIASSVALGAITLVSEPPTKGDVLHVSLEDGERRIQKRMTKYFGADRRNWPPRMTIATKWRRLDKGGIEDLREWCQSSSNPRLITIDVLQKVRPATKGSDTGYTTDYEANEKLIQLCHEFPGLAIVVAHHDRKMDADDPFDTISGTLGLTGGVDTIMLLKRHTRGVTLHMQGRDLVDTVEKAAHFDRETARWTILGEATDVHRSKEERLVIETLRSSGTLNVKALMDATGIGRNKLDLLLGRMVKSGTIEKAERGVYGLPTEPTQQEDELA